MRARVLLCAVAATVVGCGGGDSYRLYRNSALDKMDGNASRYPIATFDAPEKGGYNFENCQRAAGLFQAQPGVITKFWCEKS